MQIEGLSDMFGLCSKKLVSGAKSVSFITHKKELKLIECLGRVADPFDK